MRDPRRLGDQRVRVQIALGDLADPPSFRNALRGVDTVVHLAAAIRDQPRASIEELNAMATLRLVRAAERAGARRFMFFSAMGAGHHSRTRFFRAKALAQEAVEDSRARDHGLRPSIVYAPGDPWLTLLERFSYLPAIPVSGSGGRATSRSGPRTWPTAWWRRWALRRGRRRASSWPGPRRSPTTRSCAWRCAPAAAAAGCCTCRCRWCGPRCGCCGSWPGRSVFATWEEAELMEEPMTTPSGTADAESLGVRPLPMAAVLGRPR